jgi:uncharacterized short protein YbdD (DUF466 family)
MIRALVTFWRGIRTLSGDDAYERYLAHTREKHADAEPMSRREFYDRQQRDKWQGVSRCC